MADNFVPIVDEVYEAFRREFDDKIRAIEGNLDIENETKIDVLQKRLEWLERPAFVTAMEKDGRAEVLDYYDHIKQRLIDRIGVLTKDEETFKERKAAYLKALDGIKAKMDDLNVSEYSEQALDKKYGKTLSLEHIKNGTEITTIGLDVNTSLNETTPGQKQDLASKQEKLSEIFKAINKANEECLLNRVWLADPQFKAAKTAMDSYKSQIEIYKAHVKKMADIVNDIIDKVKAVDVDIETYKNNIKEFKKASEDALYDYNEIGRDADTDDGSKIPFGEDTHDALGTGTEAVLNYEYNSIINKFTLNTTNIEAAKVLVETITTLIGKSSIVNKELIDKYNEVPTPATEMMQHLYEKFRNAARKIDDTDDFADKVAKLEEANVRLGKIRTRFNQRTVLKKYVNDLNDDKKFFKEVLTNVEGRNFEKEIKPLIDEYYNNDNPVRITARTYAGVNKKLNVNTDESSILFGVLAANHMWDTPNNGYAKMLTVRTADNTIVIKNTSKEDLEVVKLRIDLINVQKKIKAICEADSGVDEFKELYKDKKWVRYWEEKKSKLVKSLGGLKRTILTKFINPDLEELTKKENELETVLSFRKARGVLNKLKAPVNFTDEKLNGLPTIAEANNILTKPFEGKYPVQYNGIDDGVVLSIFTENAAGEVRQARNQFTDIISNEGTTFSYIDEGNAIAQYTTTADDAGFKEDDQDIRNIITDYENKYKEYLNTVAIYRNKAKEQERIYNKALEKYTDVDNTYTNDLSRFVNNFVNRELNNYDAITALITDASRLMPGNKPPVVGKIDGVDDFAIKHYLANDDTIKAKDNNIKSTFEKAKMYYDTLIRDRNLIILAGGDIPNNIDGSGVKNVPRLSAAYKTAEDLIKAYADKASIPNEGYRYTRTTSHKYGDTYVKAAYDDLGRLITSLTTIGDQLKNAKIALDNVENPQFNNHDVLAKNNLNNLPHTKYFDEVYSKLVAKINDYSKESITDANPVNTALIKQLNAQYEHLGRLQQNILSNFNNYKTALGNAVTDDPTNDANALIDKITRGESINSIHADDFTKLNERIDTAISALSIPNLNVKNESSDYHRFVDKDEINYPFTNYNNGRLASIRAYQKLKTNLARAEVRYNEIIQIEFEKQVENKRVIIEGIKKVLTNVDKAYRLPIGEESHDDTAIETYVFSGNEKLKTPDLINNPSKLLKEINNIINNINTSINDVKSYNPEEVYSSNGSRLMLSSAGETPEMSAKLEGLRGEAKNLISKLVGAAGKLPTILGTYIAAKKEVETKVNEESDAAKAVATLLGTIRDGIERKVDFMSVDSLYAAAGENTEAYKAILVENKNEIDKLLAKFADSGELHVYAESALIKNNLKDLGDKSRGLGNAINYLTNKVIAYDPNDSKIDKFVKYVEELKGNPANGISNKERALKDIIDIMESNQSYALLEKALGARSDGQNVDEFLNHVDGEIRQVNEYIKSLEAIISGPNENNPDNIANATIDTEHGANGVELTEDEKKKFKANKDARDGALAWMNTAIRNATDLKEKLNRLRANVAKPTPTPTPEGPKPGTETGEGHNGDSAGTTPITPSEGNTTVTPSNPTEGAGHEGPSDNTSQPQPGSDTPHEDNPSEVPANNDSETNDGILTVENKEAINVGVGNALIAKESLEDLKNTTNAIKKYKTNDNKFFAEIVRAERKLNDIEMSNYTAAQFEDEAIRRDFESQPENAGVEVDIVSGSVLKSDPKYAELFDAETGAPNTKRILKAYDVNKSGDNDEKDKYIVVKGGNA